jgi:NhaA family Na+:H+ antiporter
VLLALFVPTRPPPKLKALVAQANAIVQAEAERGPQALRHGPSLPALKALDAIHDRLESPAARMLRAITPWSSFLVLPLFALANAGIALSLDLLEGREPLVLAIVLGLVLGKPIRLVVGCALAVRTGLAQKPAAFSWRQLAGAGALAGIGFTMSLYIAGQAFPTAGDYAAAKMAVLAASFLSGLIGVALLWRPGPAGPGEGLTCPLATRLEIDTAPR